jgi:spore germination protein GerM
MEPASRRYLIPLLMLLLLAAGLFAYQATRRAKQHSPPSAVTVEPLPQREVILYFGSRNGMGLVAEARDVADAGENRLAEEIIRELGDGPDGDLVPVLPAGAVLRGYSELDGVATLDFSRELVSAHPGGSMSELLTVYGLANSLAVNVPHIRKVRILVEGQAVETLKGHVDLRQPVAADFRFTDPAAENAAATPQENL